MNNTDEQFDPLSPAVEEKSYTNSGMNFSEQQLNMDIPEPTFTPPPPQPGENQIPGQEQPKAQQKEEKKKFNPAMETASSAEQQAGAEKMADAVFSGYQLLHDLGNHLIKVSPKKIDKLQRKGEINLKTVIPMHGGEYATLAEFIEEFNTQAGTALKIDQEFIDVVRPPLVRELAKRGHGMNDLQSIGFYTVQDLGKKGVMIYQLMSTAADVMAFAREQTAAGKRPPTPTTATETGAADYMQQAAAATAATEPVKQAAPAQQQAPAPAPEYMPSAEEQQQMQQEQQPTNNIQQQALSKLGGLPGFNPNTTTGAPDFGNPETLASMNKMANKTQAKINKQEQQKRKVDKENGVPVSKMIIKPTPGYQVSKKSAKKRGRPVGSKGTKKK